LALLLVGAAVFFATRRRGSTAPSNASAALASQPARATAPTTTTTREPGAIDLLARVRLPEDVVSGQWTRPPEGDLHVAGKAPGRLRLGAPPAGDYDLRVEFTPLVGSQGVGVVLSRYGQSFLFGVAPDSDRALAFGLEKGKVARRQQLTSAPGLLRNDVRHTYLIQVRRHGAIASVDGVTVARLVSVDFGELDVPRPLSVGRNALGLVTYRSLIVHSAVCTPVKDQPDQPGP